MVSTIRSVGVNNIDKLTKELIVFSEGFYFETKEVMINLASEAINNTEIPEDTGELLGSFEIDDMEGEEVGKFLKKITITNTAPHAIFVAGPTKKHFVSFKAHPELKAWADRKIDLDNDKKYRGLFVYRLQFPYSTRYRNFMDSISDYIDLKLRDVLEITIEIGRAHV